MNKLYFKFKKKMTTLKKYILMTIKLQKEFGSRVSSPYFFKNVVFKNEDYMGKRFHKKQYDSLKKVMKERYSFILDKYKCYKKLDNEQIIGNSKNIWMIWWQGFDENTSEVIIENYKQIVALNHNWNVFLVTEYNYKNFVEIPDYIQEYIEKEKLSFTHISDYLRIVLLEKYGGVYIDCNFYSLRPFDFLVNEKFYTIKHGHFSDWHVSKGMWTTGLLAAGKHDILFIFLKEMYDTFFKDIDFVPSYFFIDVLISLGYENISLVKSEIDHVAYNNENYNFINDFGNYTYNQITWNSIRKNTYLFNTNYKNVFQILKNGEKTYFGYLKNCKGDYK